jgi:hypothetical protein
MTAGNLSLFASQGSALAALSTDRFNVTALPTVRFNGQNSSVLPRYSPVDVSVLARNSPVDMSCRAANATHF